MTTTTDADTKTTVHGPRIRRVGIVGTGIMGAGLAEVSARSGCSTIVCSRQRATADDVLTRLEMRTAKELGAGRIEADTRAEILALVSSTDQLDDLGDCDLVIESVVEDLDVKRRLFIELDRVVHGAAILATNTSTLPVIEMAMSTGRPSQVCGIHFFNPAPVMKLVEIVRPLTASEQTIAAARDFVDTCGKQAVETKDRAGFIVNALLFPYLNNAVRLAEQATASIADIDVAMKGGCNFPMGPFALLDLVGLDTSVAILDALYAETRDPSNAPVPTLRRMVSAGHLGRKSGQGFFEY